MPRQIGTTAKGQVDVVGTTEIVATEQPAPGVEETKSVRGRFRGRVGVDQFLKEKHEAIDDEYPDW